MIKNTHLLFFFILLLSLASISLVSAEVQTLGIFTKGETVILTQTCDNCTYVNITTVQYPKSPVEVINIQMTEQVQGNYNYSFTNTNEFGKYIVTTCGDPDGYYACSSYDFNIGNTAVVYILLIGGVLLLGVGAWLKYPILGVASGALLTISGIYFIVLVSDVYTQTVGYTSLFIGLAVAFSAAYEYFIE